MVIEFDQVRKELNGKRILQNLSFHVREGTVFGLLGPNGAGKTTAIRLICGLWKPTDGAVRVAGIDMAKSPLAGRKLLGVVPSDIGLYADLTVLENIELIAGFYGTKRDRIDQLVGEMALWEVRHKQVSRLSKGMQQKVAIIRALVHNPRVLILDEPTSALDLASTQAVEAFIASRRQTGITTLLCTHDIHQALRLCDEILVLNEGQIFWKGLRAEVESADWLMDLVIRARNERQVEA